MSIVNLALVRDVKEIGKSKDGKPTEPPSLNISRLKTRAANNIERKKRTVKAFKAGVSPDGQKLFQAISKT